MSVLWRVNDAFLRDTKGNPLLVKTVVYDTYLEVGQTLLTGTCHNKPRHMYNLPLDKLLDNITKQLTNLDVDMDSGINDRALDSIMHTATYQRQMYNQRIKMESVTDGDYK